MNYVLITAHGFNSDMAPAEPIVAIDPTIRMKTPQQQGSAVVEALVLSAEL